MPAGDCTSSRRAGRINMNATRRRFLLAAALGGATAGRGVVGGAGTAAQTAGAGTQSPVTAPPGAVPPDNAFTYRRNWGRWGNDDQMGAANLITPAKRAAAAAVVKTGRAVSLSRPFQPEQHFVRINQRGAAPSV